MQRVARHPAIDRPAAPARRPPGAPHRPMADVLPVLGLVALGLLPDPDVRSSALAAVLVPLPLLARRRWPVPVFAAVAAIAAARLAAGENSLSDAGLLLALYTVAAAGPAWQAVASALLAEGAALAAIARYAEDDGLGPAVGVTGLVAAAAAAGVSVRTRRELVASLRERAARLEVERDRERQLATTAERARISREMHDIVAHNLAVMVALADGAANVATRTPQRAERAALDIAATGRTALAEMRRVLGVLREDGPEATAPQPGLADLPALVAQVQGAGLAVTACGLAEPAPGVSPGLGLAVYRIVQESLTNALKHAGPGAAATVELRWEGRRVTVAVGSTNAGGGPRGTGGGLTGMRERAAALGGTLEAGPDGRGGWRVLAVLGDDDPVAGGR